MTAAKAVTLRAESEATDPVSLPSALHLVSAFTISALPSVMPFLNSAHSVALHFSSKALMLAST